jgi:hypothetical protein
MANTLIAQTSLPLFITGDMNEREEYFCAMAGGAPMKAANGGKHKAGVCAPPPYPMPVDWIFGAKGRMKFSNYVRDNSRLVRRITDHFVIRADVTIPTSWTDPTLPPAPPVWPLPIDPTEPTYPPPPCPTTDPTYPDPTDPTYPDPTYPEPTEPTWPAPPCPTEPTPTDPTEPTYPAAG